MDTRNKATPKASATTRTRRKSVWRLIGGFLLMAGAGNSFRNMPREYYGHPVEVIAYWAVDFLLIAIGIWLMASYLFQKKAK
jgi:hypothetical protein